jgi:hypothetical protein
MMQDMPKMKYKWNISPESKDYEPALIRFEKYLKNLGLSESTIRSYLYRIDKFLRFAGSDKPPMDSLPKYLEHVKEKNISLSSLNIISFAVRHYYRMLGEEVDFSFITPNNNLPYYFDVPSHWTSCDSRPSRTEVLAAAMCCVDLSLIFRK